MKKLNKKLMLPLIIGVVAVIVVAIILVNVFSHEEKVTPAHGSLILNIGSAVQIDYDADGMVAELTAANGLGSMLLEKVTDYDGIPAVDLVDRLLTAAKEEDYFSGLKVVVMRQMLGSQLPQKEGFLPDLRDHVQSQVGENCKVILISVDELTLDNLINLDAAQYILQNHYGDAITDIYGTEQLRNTYYGLSATLDGENKFFLVDAYIGSIMEGNADDFFLGMEESYPSESDDILPTEFVDPADINPDEEFILPI